MRGKKRDWSTFSKNPWTDAGDALLREGVGQGLSWNAIGELFEDRTGKQIRERWHNQLSPSIVHGTWTQKELERLWAAYSDAPNQWTRLAKMFPGRTANAVKNIINSMKRKNARMEASHVTTGSHAMPAKRLHPPPSGAGGSSVAAGEGGRGRRVASRTAAKAGAERTGEAGGGASVTASRRERASSRARPEKTARVSAAGGAVGTQESQPALPLPPLLPSCLITFPPRCHLSFPLSLLDKQGGSSQEEEPGSVGGMKSMMPTREQSESPENHPLLVRINLRHLIFSEVSSPAPAPTSPPSSPPTSPHAPPQKENLFHAAILPSISPQAGKWGRMETRRPPTLTAVDQESSSGSDSSSGEEESLSILSRTSSPLESAASPQGSAHPQGLANFPKSWGWAKCGFGVGLLSKAENEALASAGPHIETILSPITHASATPGATGAATPSPLSRNDRRSATGEDVTPLHLLSDVTPLHILSPQSLSASFFEPRNWPGAS